MKLHRMAVQPATKETGRTPLFLIISIITRCLGSIGQIIFFVLFADQLPDIPGNWTEKELIRDLLQDYEKKARPVVDGVSPIAKLSETLTVQQITIEFGLSIIQILELDENEQVLTSSMQTLYVGPFARHLKNPHRVL